MDKERLTRGGRGPQGLPVDTIDIEVDGEVETLTVRGLNRGEMITLGKLSDDEGQEVAERYMLSCALIDPADMTREDVAAWQESSPGMEMHPVIQLVNALSGAGKVAEKSRLHEVRTES